MNADATSAAGTNIVLDSHTGHILSFFFNDTATTEIYTLSLHDALPILSSLIAPAGCDRAPIPRLDANRVNKREIPVVCPLPSRCCATDPNANRVTSTAVRHKRNVRSARRLTKAARRKFFVFMAEDLSETSHKNRLPASLWGTETVRFRAISRVCVLAKRASNLRS